MDIADITTNIALILIDGELRENLGISITKMLPASFPPDKAKKLEKMLDDIYNAKVELETVESFGAFMDRIEKGVQ